MLTTVELEGLAGCIENGADLSKISGRDKDGWSLIHSAAYYGNMKLLKYLLGEGIDIELTIPGTQMTPLLLAATNGHYEVVITLLQQGANINATDHMNRTALHLTQSGKIAELLLRYGIDHQIHDKSPTLQSGETALTTATRKGKWAVQSAILKFLSDG